MREAHYAENENHAFLSVERLEFEIVSGCNGSVALIIKGWNADNKKQSKPNITVTFGSQELGDFHLLDITEIGKGGFIKKLADVFIDPSHPSVFREKEQ